MNPNPANAFAGRRVLVTGGAGFVGGSLVNRLAEAGARVTVLDDLFTGQAEVAARRASSSSQGSVEDWDLVRRLVGESSVVFHLAARNIIASHARTRESDFATNIGGTLNVLMAARECSIDRVVYTGSTSIYGNPRSIPINEDDGVTPLSPYAVSKLAGEHYCGRVLRELRDADRDRPLLQRVRRRPAARQPLLRRHLEVLRRGLRRQVRSRSTATASRRATSRTSTTRSTPRCSRRSTRAPRARCSTSAPGSRRRSTRSSGSSRSRRERELDVEPHRPPRHRQHPPPRREHREGAPDAPLGAAGDARRRARPHGPLDRGDGHRAARD